MPDKRLIYTEIEPNSPSSVKTFGFDTVTLAVPEKRIGCSALFLAFFDRGAIKSSLYRPQDALGFYAPEGEG